MAIKAIKTIKENNSVKNKEAFFHITALGYCRVQKEFAFEIASRVVSTKREMQ